MPLFVASIVGLVVRGLVPPGKPIVDDEFFSAVSS